MVRLDTSDTYFHEITEHYSGSRLWDYLRYDDNGDLWINSLRVRDSVALYGSPLEIHDMTIMKRRADWWRDQVHKIAREVGYTGRFSFFYASKANMTIPYVNNAYRYGWFAETSSIQDLIHLERLYSNGLIQKDIPIICNGFKFVTADSMSDKNIQSNVEFVSPPSQSTALPDLYASEILRFHAEGFSIMPILDTGELEYFQSQFIHGIMDVGLRLKFGLVQNDEQLARCISRHGMTWDELVEQAGLISQSPQLSLKMLHIMVSAAEVTPVDDLVSSLLYGVEKYFELKQKYPSLEQLNIGGGIPPVTSGYDYEVYLQRLLSGTKRLASSYQSDMPEIVFELGSFLSDESGFLVHKVLQRKHNSVSDTPGQLKWAIIDGGLMAELPDMFVTHKQFPVLAGNNAHEKASTFVLGDLSCDSDGRYPSKHSSQSVVFLPDADDQIVVFSSVGAYQKMLSGVGGAHHCGILNPAQLILEEVDGIVKARFISAQSMSEYAKILGFEYNKSEESHLMAEIPAVL